MENWAKLSSQAFSLLMQVRNGSGLYFKAFPILPSLDMTSQVGSGPEIAI